jgi:hypothetical protein
MPPKKFILPRINNSFDALPPTKKPRRQMKQRTNGMSNAAWAADIQRRAVVNEDRRKREAAAKMNKAAVVAAALNPPHCPGVFGSQESVSSLTSLSPSSYGDFPRRAQVHAAVQVLTVSLFRRVP